MADVSTDFAVPDTVADVSADFAVPDTVADVSDELRVHRVRDTAWDGVVRGVVWSGALLGTKSPHFV